MAGVRKEGGMPSPECSSQIYAWTGHPATLAGSPLSVMPTVHSELMQICSDMAAQLVPTILLGNPQHTHPGGPDMPLLSLCAFGLPKSGAE